MFPTVRRPSKKKFPAVCRARARRVISACTAATATLVTKVGENKSLRRAGGQFLCWAEFCQLSKSKLLFFLIILLLLYFLSGTFKSQHFHSSKLVQVSREAAFNLVGCQLGDGRCLLSKTSRRMTTSPTSAG